jgi:predicted component of type VI protein secretion system
MNRSRLIFSVFLLLSTLVVVGCAGSSYMPPPPPGSSTVTVTVTDTPPAGVTLLSFEILVTGATLNPGNVQLVTSPLKIEVKKLETESAFLATVNVPAGNYQSITVALATRS